MGKSKAVASQWAWDGHAMDKFNNLSECLEKARNGDSQAQYQLACCYRTGLDGLSQDSTEAMQWYRRAMDQGHEGAYKCYLELMTERLNGLKGKTKAETPAATGPDVARREMTERLSSLNTRGRTGSFSLTEHPEPDLTIPSFPPGGGAPPMADGLLSDLVALKGVKQQLAAHMNVLLLNQWRARHNLPCPRMSFDMIFMGNSGTGKTTVAREVGRVLHDAGILSRGHVIEVTPNDILAGSNIVEAEVKKMKKLLIDARNGVLFIDEAHNFVHHTGQASEYWRHAILELLREMTNRVGVEFVVILAGYAEGMKYLLQQEEGLKSRFTTTIHFDDYSTPELAEIFRCLAARWQYTFASGAEEALAKAINDAPHRYAKNFGNARYVRNLFDGVVRKIATRVATKPNPSKEDITLITAFDIVSAAEEVGQE